MSEISSILDAKKARITKLFRGEKTDKVPFYLKTDGYLSYFTGHGCPVDVKDWETAVEVNVQACNELKPDIIHFFTPWHLIVPEYQRILGGSNRSISEKGVPQMDAQNLNIVDSSEYSDMLKDPAAYFVNHVVPRRYPKLQKDVPAGERKDALRQILGAMGQMGGNFERCEEAAGTIAFSQTALVNGVDFVFDYYRDFVGTSKDLRRCPELLKDLGLEITKQTLHLVDGMDPIPYKVVEIPCHLGAYIGPKQFEKVYWPSMKMLVDGLHERGFNVNLMLEKNYSHVHDILQDLPTSGVMCLIEEDDLQQTRKDLPNVILAGGLSQKLMAYGTRDEVVNHVKWLIDEMACDGKFVISPNVPFMIPGDAKFDNMRAVTETIETYGRC